MAWIKVESSVSRNRKFVQAGPAPSWLWLCGLAYCQEGLTDGFIPHEALNYLGVKNAKQLAAHLVTARLWDVVDGGWQVHDYLSHNKSATEVRGITHERRVAGANGGKASGQARRTNDEANIEASTKQVASPESKQTGNPALTATASTATSTATAALARPLGPRTGLMKPPRPEAAFDGGRVWVLHKTHKDFMALRGNNEAELLAWYAEVAEAWTHGAHRLSEPGSSMFKFWDARYAERWPASAGQAGSALSAKVSDPMQAWLARKAVGE